MRAISLHQPWASLYVLGIKPWETRTWALKIPSGGMWLAIHAAKRRLNASECTGELARICQEFLPPGWWSERDTCLPRGKVIGMVFVDKIERTEDVVANCPQWLRGRGLITGNFGPGRFAWRAQKAVKLSRPFDCVGRQSLFSVEDHLIERAY